MSPVWVWGLNYKVPGVDPGRTMAGRWNFASRSWGTRRIYSDEVMFRWEMKGILYENL